MGDRARSDLAKNDFVWGDLPKLDKMMDLHESYDSH